MSALRNVGLQVQEYVYDFAVDGGAISTIVLSDKAGKAGIPVGAIIKAVTMKVLTQFTSGGSATLSWGNGDSNTGYSGAAIAVASLVDNFVANGWDNASSLLWDDTNDHSIAINVADANDGKFAIGIATATMTAGKAVFLVEYLMPTLD